MPRWWSVRELISAFLHLRDSVVLHRSEYRLEKVTARRHLVAGLMTIHLDIDAAVAVIRGSDTVDEARQGCRIDSASMPCKPIMFWDCSFGGSPNSTSSNCRPKPKLDAEFAGADRAGDQPDARRVVIDQELMETAKLFKGNEFDRRTVLDFDATRPYPPLTRTVPASVSPTRVAIGQPRRVLRQPRGSVDFGTGLGGVD